MENRGNKGVAGSAMAVVSRDRRGAQTQLATDQSNKNRRANRSEEKPSKLKDLLPE
uniref:Uncharacterized protein n=1 Tax=Melanopsichium pennsylvanicum 4 TaxID=1398559 RepID=A0A077R547_9BASI|nr:uncharacterized protein BN887_06146 [Melanopsichium pennsylvanicum 4]